MIGKSRIFSGVSLLTLAMVLTAHPAAAQDEDQGRDEIIVKGIRGSVVQSLDIKRNSVQVVDSIVAEDIGKLPDNNVIEALQRVTGVQVTNRGGGEASAVFIRGLPDVTTTWNGRLVFTASGRQLALQDIPSNLVKRVDVFKTRASEQIETGIAGQIDVMTRRPFDFDGFAFSVAARGIYQEERKTVDPNVSALISNRWSTELGDFGVLLNASFAQTRFCDQSVTAGAMVPFATPDSPPTGWTPLERIFPTDGRAPGQEIWQPGLDAGLPTAPGSTLTVNGEDFEYLLGRDALFASDFRGDRKRPAATAAIQWAPDDSSAYTFEFFYQGFRQDLFNNLHFTFADWWGALGPDPASTITLFPGSNIIKTRRVGFPFGFNSGDFTDQKTDSFVYALSGRWSLGDRLDLTGDLSYQKSDFSTQFVAVRTTRVPESISIDFNGGDGIPSWEFNDNAEMLDPSVWTVAELFENAGASHGDAFTASFDGDYDLDRADGDGFFKKLSFGFRYDDRSAAESQIPPRDSAFLGQPLDSLDPGFQWVNKGFFDGRANVPSSWVVANGYFIRDNRDDVRALYGVTAPQLMEAFTIDERSIAGYLQLDLEPRLFDQPFFIQAGVRYVNVKTDMTFTDLNDPLFPMTDASAKVDDLLPSVTLRYDATDDFRLRFNYGKTLRRPNFADLNPNFSLTGDLTMSVGAAGRVAIPSWSRPERRILT
ncbi:TonB-dependent receptor [Amphiplicatus metriothermophilus]|uniref:TonB-dependent receptor n=1 Tax=Amphiplicatus metriothermophilus TaxID=1519374 RepID=UPI00178EAF9F|nr:TonB-dependent receptor [Amphiplicatus metriothermophilus]